MKVSILIPTYNRAHLISRAIESVLAQTHKDYEIVVVDDGSTDNTTQILEVYKDRIKYIYKPNGGVSSARNLGLKHISGDFLVFLDSDDIIYPDKLQIQSGYLVKHPKIDVVCSAWKEIDNDNLSIEREYKPEKPKKILEKLIWESYAFPIHAVMIRRDCLKKVPEFDINLPASEDTDFWVRLALAGYKFGCTPDLVCEYIKTPNSLSQDKALLHELDNRLLGKNFSDPLFPVRLLKKKNEIFAYYKFRSGIHFFSSSEQDDKDKLQIAQKFFNEALLLDKNILRRRKELEISITNKALKYHPQNPIEYVTQIVQNLLDEPEEQKRLNRKSSARVYLNQAFWASSRKNKQETYRNVHLAIKNDIHWLFNKGVISIIIKNGLNFGK